MRAYLARFGAPLAVVAFAAACGSVSSIDDSNQEAGSIEESSLPAFVAEAQCAQQMSCDCYLEAGPVGEDPVQYTHDKCIENRKIELTHWQGRMQAYGLHYDSQCAAHKVASAQEWACSDGNTVAAIELEQRDCANRCRVYHGDVPLGGVCEQNIDACAQGLVCRGMGYDPSTGEYTSRCVSNCAGAGAECSYEECAPGFFCRYTYENGGDTSICERLPLEGEPCLDYTCGVSYCTEANVCAAYLEDGATCDPLIPCRGTCDDGVCAPGTPRVCSWDLRQSQ